MAETATDLMWATCAICSNREMPEDWKDRDYTYLGYFKVPKAEHCYHFWGDTEYFDLLRTGKHTNSDGITIVDKNFNKSKMNIGIDLKEQAQEKRISDLERKVSNLELEVLTLQQLVIVLQSNIEQLGSVIVEIMKIKISK